MRLFKSIIITIFVIFTFNNVSYAQINNQQIDSLATEIIKKILNGKDSFLKSAAAITAEDLGINKFTLLLKKNNLPTIDFILARNGDNASLKKIVNQLNKSDEISIDVCELLSQNHELSYFKNIKKKIPFKDWDKSPTAINIAKGFHYCIATSYIDKELAINELNNAVSKMTIDNFSWYGRWIILALFTNFKSVSDSTIIKHFNYLESVLVKTLPFSNKKYRAYATSLLLKFNNSQYFSYLEDYLDDCINGNTIIDEDIVNLALKYRSAFIFNKFKNLITNKTYGYLARKVILKIDEVPLDYQSLLLSFIRPYRLTPKDLSFSESQIIYSENDLSAFAIEMLFKHRYQPYLSSLKISIKDSLESGLFYKRAVKAISIRPVSTDTTILEKFAALPFTENKYGPFNDIVDYANVGLSKLGYKQSTKFIVCRLSKPDIPDYTKFALLSLLIRS